MAREKRVTADEAAMPRIVTGVPKAGFERDYDDFKLAEHVTVRNVLSGLDNALLDLSDRLETLEKALIPVLEQELDAEQDWEPEMARPASMDAPVIGDIRRMRAFAEAMVRHVVDLTGRVQV